MRFQMIRPAALSPTGNSRMAGSYADLILGCLHREIRRLFHRTVESEGQEHMEALRREIGAAPAEDWSQKKIASKLNMSVSTLLRRIRKLHDTTPSDLILHFRLRSAARLLAGTDRPIFFIAEFAGYESTSSFAATFKKHFKCPPRIPDPMQKLLSSSVSFRWRCIQFRNQQAPRPEHPFSLLTLAERAIWLSITQQICAHFERRHSKIGLISDGSCRSTRNQKIRYSNFPRHLKEGLLKKTGGSVCLPLPPSGAHIRLRQVTFAICKRLDKWCQMSDAIQCQSATIFSLVNCNKFSRIGI